MSGTALWNAVEVGDGETVSSGLALNGAEVIAIVLPPAVTSTTCTFQMAMDGPRGEDPVTWRTAVSTAGSDFSITFAADDWVVVDPNALSGCQHLRLVMGSAEAADRTIGVVTRRRV